jgi:hypothetical protein
VSIYVLVIAAYVCGTIAGEGSLVCCLGPIFALQRVRIMVPNCDKLHRRLLRDNIFH